MADSVERVRAQPNGAGPARAVLVIGATGILRSAVESLIARGRAVVAVGRDRAELAVLAAACGPGVHPVPVDARVPADLAVALHGAKIDGALVYDPAVSRASCPVLSRLVDGPIVHLLTSAVAAPAAGSNAPCHLDDAAIDPAASAAPFVRLVLGWTEQRRWHTPTEVSAAAIAMLDRVSAGAQAAAPFGLNPLDLPPLDLPP